MLREDCIVLDDTHHLADIASIASGCLFACDLICGGFPCQPFSNARTNGAHYSANDWKSWDQLMDALQARVRQGVQDRALLLENVLGLLEKLTAQKLQMLTDAGFHYKIFRIDSAAAFGCATTRPRIAIVAFRDAQHLTKFGRGPRPTGTAAGTPLSQIINQRNNSPAIMPPKLWLRGDSDMYKLWNKNNGVQVVSPATDALMNVRTKANSSFVPDGNGGTFICVHPSVAQQTTPLTDQQLAAFATYFVHQPDAAPIVRRLMPDEELRAMGWDEKEIPAAFRSAYVNGSPHKIYEYVSESICPPVWTAVAARMLWAMGKELPQGVSTAEADPSHVQLRQTCSAGIEYWKVLPLLPD